MPRPQRVTIGLKNGNETVNITADLLKKDIYRLNVDGQQLKPYIDSLPATDPDRGVMLTLLAFGGACPAITFTIPDQFGGGTLVDNQARFGKGTVKAMLVQSRRQKQIDDGAHQGKEDGRCNDCQNMLCGLNELLPFGYCLCIEGVFDGMCGNSLWHQ